MKSAKPLKLFVIIFAFCNLLTAQTAPNLENGFKQWGSYDSSNLDTVNNLNGNQMLHAPLLPNYPQRGGRLTMQSFLYQTSKTWQPFCSVDFNGQVTCQWTVGRSGVNLRQSEGLTIQRTLHQYGSGTGQISYKAYGYTIEDATGAVHQVIGTGPLDSTGEATKFDSIDTSGYHLEMSSPDSYGVMNTATVTDRHGTQYVATNWIGGTDTGPTFCPQLPGNHLPPVRLAGGLVEPMIDDAPMGQQDCAQDAFATQITDSNGNFISNPGVGPTDTLGRNFAFYNGGTLTTDYRDCTSSHVIAQATFQSYTAPDGTTRQAKLCYGNIPISTAFNVPGIVEINGFNLPELVTVVLADGSKWTFDYDNYGQVTFVGLPTGGSISYIWTTIAFPSCAPADGGVSRAVASRTLNDGSNSHSYTWNYGWGAVVGNTMSNTVTDPAGNDTVHVFTALDGAGNCGFYETRTQSYQGTGSSRQLLKQVDTSYSSASYAVETIWGSGLGDVVPLNIQTTIYPNGKVNLIQKTYAPPAATGRPISGNVATEKVYDWGQGAPGSLLRETDTTYQWQNDSRYNDAHMVDLPATVVIKDGGGCKLSATDYTYDEAAYFTGTTVSTQHGAAPNPAPVRGNQTTVTRWLAPTSSCDPKSGTAVTSHTNWYDTGEPYQQIDPLGHTTTHTYDSFYAGAYATKTCSPSTASVAHCVSGTYDFNTGVLTSLTNENATTQASGNTQGDAAHTSNYTYDYMFRITSAKAPPDPANGGLNAQTSFNFSAPNVFPLSVQRTKSITSSLTDSATSFFDGLGRNYKSQHVLPGGTATVDTTFDDAHSQLIVTNPYFSTADLTYGSTTTLSDGLGRAIQVTKQDGSISKMAYSVQTTVAVNGDCTQTTDEAGKQRGTCSDALGRLVEVDEPNPGNPVQMNYKATLLTDGNFVIENAAGIGIWSTGTYGTNATSIYMQDDGNLVLYIFKWQAGTYATPSPGPFPAASCSIGSYLMVNQRLNANQCIASPHGQYLLYMASDGNFYIYDLAHNTGTWGPGTYGHPGAYAMLQSDGNFVVYDANGVGIWSSGTYGTNADRLNMEDDGRIIIYKSAWNSGTSDGQFYGTAIAHPGCDVGNSGLGSTGILGSGSCLVSPNGRFELLMQGDGNLVIYDRSVTPNKSWWSSGTAISTADPGFAMRTFYSYDALGNPTCVEQHGDATTGTGCSASPTSDATSPWRVRRFTYDSLSRLLTAKNPESGTITYSYDADGNLLQKTSPAPNQTGSATQTVSYCYDELHRVTAKGYGAQSCPLATPVVTYAYDSGANAKGKLTSLTDQAGTASYSYDILGRLTAETRTLTGANNSSISKNLSYDYNLDGSLYKLHYPSGNVVTYEPGVAGLTLSAKDTGNNINYVTSATYGPDSGLTGFISGYSTSFAGITNAFSYNKRLQPLNMSASAPGQTVFSIGYDFHVGNGDNGNVFGITNYKDNTRNQTFTYDLLNRLASAQNAGTDCTVNVLGGNKKFWGNTYAYDAWGNLINKTKIGTACAGENLSLTADAHNWIHATGGSDYQYDAAGNMTFNATPPTQTYTYDQENRLTGAAGYTYTYDGDGNRVRKSSSGSTGTLYWYMTPGIVGESDLSGNLTDEYVFFGGERVARKSTNGVFYYFSDHLKTASVITDSAGVIKAESDYYPWGGELQFVSNDSNHYKFTGKERDSETQLDYFGARYYSNGLGRWVSADWSPTPVPVPYANFGDPQSLNLYGFVGGNPASKADPDGHDPYWYAAPILMGPESVKDAFNAMADLVDFALHRYQPHAGAFPQPQPCTCPEPQKQDNKNQNNNNSKSTNQQGSGGQSGAKQGGLKRPPIRKSTRAAVHAKAPKTPDGKPIDPNTGKAIEGTPDLGHKPGNEFWREKANAEAEGLTQKEFNDRMNDPDKYQLEDPSSNRSHQFEQPREAQPEKKPPE